jgi:ATP-binding cassette subfamily B protein
MNTKDTEINEKTNKIPNTPFAFIWHVTKPHKGLAFLSLVSVGLAQATGLFSIYAISQLIDAFGDSATKEAQMNSLVYWGAVFVILGILDRVFWRVSGFSGITWAIKANKTAYDNLYHYISGHSHGYFTSKFAGALSNKVSNAANGAADVMVRFVWTMFPEIVSLVVTIYLFFKLSWSIGLITSVIFASVLVFNIWFVKKRRPHVVKFSKSASILRGKGVDLLNNISATRQYSRRMVELTDIQFSTKDMVKKDIKQAYMGEWLMLCNGVFSMVMIVVILFVVYGLLKNDLATAGELVLILILLSRISFTFNIMGNVLNGMIRKYGEIEEGLEEILLDHEIVDEEFAKDLNIENSQIKLQDVTFEFDGNQIFNNLNLDIKPNQKLGLIGKSGAGKSTLVSLLLREHDIEAGSIEIDDQDISKVTQDSLRKNIAIVPQEPALFHRTIKDNILYGKMDATEEELIEVAKKAQAYDFIMALPGGFETMVGERGVKLSGGQKQRVAIARAMLKNAPILILDEATSALDSESEVAIQKALETLMEGRTVIAIAHRLSTLRKMDRIIVMEQGDIVEDGNHDSLSKAGGMYERLWSHQAGGFLQD